MNTEQRIERRVFFKWTGFTLAASALGGGGLDATSLFSPEIGIAAERHAEIPTPGKVLIAYASRAGSTGEVAEAIAHVLNGKEIPAEAIPVGRVADVRSYRAVIVGSAIRMGSWLPEGAKFVEKNRTALVGMPTAFFTVCLTMQKDTSENRRTVEGYMQPVLKIFRPANVGLFGGKMDYSRLGFLDRLIVTKMKKVPEGDYRDWKAIRSWAGEFRPA